ncbi:Transporter [Sandaracinus amylolyticus]|nr:Transporter [Sandaracinus amylolyticus]
MSCSRGVALCALVLAMGIAGCDGSDHERPRVELDGASGGADAGPVSGDECETLGDTGACSGTIARWCEGGTVREEDCADDGRVCGTVAGRHRCAEPPPPECGDPIEQEQLRLTNDERVRAGLSPLVCDPGLTRAARLHSQDMCDQGYFDHDSLDGRTFRDRIDAQDVTWRAIGENIARGQPTPADVHEAWMNSPGHRANIMGEQFGRIGIGHVACGGTGPYWTQDFAD